MNIAQSVKSLIDLPTVENGGRKQRNWLTNLHHALEHGDFSVTTHDDGVAINGTSIDVAVAIVQSLETVGNGGFSNEKLQEYLSLHEAGMPSALALAVSKKGEKAAFVRSPKSVLSAEQYRRSRIRESLASLSKDDEFVEALATMCEWDSSKRKKESLAWLDEFLGRIFPAESREVYNLSLEKERRRAQKWDALYRVGFCNVIQREDGSMSGEISFISAKEGAKTLEREGYRVLSKVPDMEAESFHIVFQEVSLPSQSTDETVF